MSDAREGARCLCLLYGCMLFKLERFSLNNGVYDKHTFTDSSAVNRDKRSLDIE
jgi:hypothetical protein